MINARKTFVQLIYSNSHSHCHYDYDIFIFIFFIFIFFIAMIIDTIYIIIMEKIFMNTENSNTNESNRFKLDLTDKLKNLKILRKTWL